MKVDYTAIDKAIMENQSMSANQMIKIFGLNCSDSLISRRRRTLGVKAPYARELKRTGNKESKPKDTELQKTMCQCPKCRKKYVISAYYTGRGVYWKFCDFCKNHPNFSDWESCNPECHASGVTSALHYQNL